MKLKHYLLILPFLIVFIITSLFVAGIAIPRDEDSNLYVALGDSVAAGIGLQNPDPSSDGCSRTTDGYPNIVANTLGYELKNYACSGASIKEGLLESQKTDDKSQKPQIEQLKTLPKPKLITVTIGANDIAWTEPLARCYAAKCGSTRESQEITSRLSELRTNLKQLFNEIEKLYDNSPPRLVLTTYYGLFPADFNTCTVIGTDNVTADEVLWLREQFGNLNRVLQNTAKSYDFITISSPDFTMHDICSLDSWVQDLEDTAPFHPTAEGQKAVATSIIEVL